MAALSHKCQEFNDLFKLYKVILRKGLMYQCGSDATLYFQISCHWNFIQNLCSLGGWTMKSLELRQLSTESRIANAWNRCYRIHYEVSRGSQKEMGHILISELCGLIINTGYFCVLGNLYNSHPLFVCFWFCFFVQAVGLPFHFTILPSTKTL